MRIRKALENAIVDGRFAPGLKIDPEELALEFNCSRTPIREVLQQLQESGLVRVVLKRGTFVSQWNADEVTERIEVMAEIEAMCARLAARRITNPELQELEQAHEACRLMTEKKDAGGLQLGELHFSPLYLSGDTQRLSVQRGCEAARHDTALSSDPATSAQ